LDCELTPTAPVRKHADGGAGNPALLAAVVSRCRPSRRSDVGRVRHINCKPGELQVSQAVVLPNRDILK
jgi:hypothetical protein